MYPDTNFVPDFCMTDAEIAEREAALHQFPTTNPLMCFFHVQKNAKDRLKKLGSTQEVQTEIKSDIADLHSAINEDTFDSMYEEKERKWDDLAPAGFASYFRKQ